MSDLTIHVQQASMEAFDTNRQATSDFDTIFDRRAHVTGLTETGVGGLRDEAIASAKRHGCTLVGGKGDTGLVVGKGIPILGHGSKLAHRGGRDSFGGYGPRYVDWVTVDIDGEILTVCEFHRVRPKTPERRLLGRMTVQTALDLVRDKAIDKRLALMLYDLNEDDNPGDRGASAALFDDAGVTTIWDELGYWPETGPGGGTIDGIASVDADTRVQAVGAFVWPRLNADHPQVSGFYGVRR